MNTIYTGIKYEIVPSGTEISIIGQQKSNNTIASMRYKDKMVYMQQEGILTKDEMINNFKSGNKFITNLLRFVGWFMMFLGLNMILNPISAVFKFIPIAKSIIGNLSTIVSLLISASLSFITIAVAWFAYRPILLIVVILITGGIIFILKNKLAPIKK